MKYIKKLFYFSFTILFVFWALFILYQNKIIRFPTKTFNIQNRDRMYEMPVIKITDSNKGLDSDESNTINIYQRLNTAVVNVSYTKTEYIRYFFDFYPQKSEGQGSGVIIDQKGYIVTNFHVVGDAEKVTISLSQDEDVYNAEIIGIDPANDLAVIKIKNPPPDLNIIPLGTSNDLKIGQKVYAIGNPFGLDRTLTSGIISALGRPIKTDDGNILENTIQTDASINPGNSGGPLIDSAGRMIGINTMIISPSGGSIGLGFAIPIDTVREVVEELVRYGYVKRGWIDATFLPITPRISRSLGYYVDHGLMIMTVVKNGEAYKAGLRGGKERAYYGSKIVYIGGEIITEVDGVRIKDYSALANVLKDNKPGENVTVGYYKGNKKYTTSIKLIDKRKFTGMY